VIPSSTPIRVVVADDSPTSRELLVALLEDDPQVAVVAQASNGAEAVDAVATHRPDVVTMDIVMPVMNGYDATREIMTRTPTPILIVSGHRDVREASVSMEALGAGAVMLLPKLAGPTADRFEMDARRFVSSVKAMADVSVVRRHGSRKTPRRVAAAGPRSHVRAEVLAIGTSTGGPAALAAVLSELPADFPAPILVVQHMADKFVASMARWLDDQSGVTVKVAEAGERLVGGVMYVAPPDRHLKVSAGRTVALSDSPPVGQFRPSASPLFQSVGEVYGPSALGIIMTGMGSDGVDGLRALRELGGYIMAQDEASCVVFGMPRRAIESGVVHEVVPVGEIAARMLALAGRSATGEV